MEHRWTLESRLRSRRTPLGNVDYWAQVRYVCSCGVATKWQAIERRARRERDRHVLDGQLAHDE